MKISDLTKQIRYLDIVTSKKVTEIFAGNYKSSFKGNGMEFEDVREYVYGDDIKNIDWNLTAREGKAYIKKYHEERELTTFFIIDVSATMNFGTQEFLKSEIALKIAAILGFSTVKNSDKLGAIIHANNYLKYLPPRKGKVNTLRFLRDLIIGFNKNKAENSNLKQALTFFLNLVKKKTICFLITDEIDLKASKELIMTNKKHDLVLVRIQDILEAKIDKFKGLISFADSINNDSSEIELTDELKQAYIKNKTKYDEKIRKFCMQNKIDILDLNTESNLLKELIFLFKKRQKRY